MSKNTKIENDVLTIGADESSYQVIVKATKDDLEYTLTLNVENLYGLSPNYVTVAKGSSQQFSVLNNKTGEKMPAENYEWSVAPYYGEITSADTKVDATGLFTMGADEECTYVRLIAKDKETDVEYTVGISQPWEYSINALSNVTPTAISLTSVKAEPTVSLTSVSLDAKVAPVSTNADLTVSQEVVWTVEGAKSAATKIDENSTLTIGIDETAAQLFVTATSVADTTKSDTAVVNVTPKQQYYIEVIAGEHGTVTPSSGNYYEDTDVTFTFTPDEGYKVDRVTVDGKEVKLKDNTYTLTVTGTTQIVASFAEASAESPDTGDYTPIFAALMLAVMGVAGCAVYVARRKRI